MTAQPHATVRRAHAAATLLLTEAREMPGLGTVGFRSGERLRTKISGKYDRESVSDLLLLAAPGVRGEY